MTNDAGGAGREKLLFRATTLTPGPNSTETATYIGHRRTDVPGPALAYALLGVGKSPL